jgi:CheY-like chemotaxis protein
MTQDVPTILIVEDERDIRETVVDAFCCEGYRALGAAHGGEALELLRAADPKPALILLDLMMPFMNGAEFRQQQLADPAIADIPVVIWSADANAGARCAELRAAGYLKKPARLRTIIDTAQRLLSSR